MKYERCINCDNPTDRAGRFKDSLYVGDYGPLCANCHSTFDGSNILEFQKHIIEELEEKCKSEYKRGYGIGCITVDEKLYERIMELKKRIIELEEK